MQHHHEYSTEMFEHLYNDKGQIPHIRALCAGLDEEAIVRAEQKYVRYLELTWRIFEQQAPTDDSGEE